MQTETIAERVAQNEHTFREANERIEEGAEKLAGDHDLIPFICECEELHCMEITTLTRDEYESVRSTGARFLVVPGHELLVLEGVTVARLVEKFERFSLMEKVGEAGEVARQLDARSNP